MFIAGMKILLLAEILYRRFQVGHLCFFQSFSKKISSFKVYPCVISKPEQPDKERTFTLVWSKLHTTVNMLNWNLNLSNINLLGEIPIIWQILQHKNVISMSSFRSSVCIKNFGTCHSEQQAQCLKCTIDARSLSVCALIHIQICNVNFANLLVGKEVRANIIYQTMQIVGRL